jgi:hypothetical protein
MGSFSKMSSRLESGLRPNIFRLMRTDIETKTNNPVVGITLARTICNHTLGKSFAFNPPLLVVGNIFTEITNKKFKLPNGIRWHFKISLIQNVYLNCGRARRVLALINYDPV